MTARREDRPASARKVPGFLVWMSEDGQPWSRYGRLSVWTRGRAAYVNAPREGGGRRLCSVAGLMQATWMPPKPAGAHRVHLDGDSMNNSASNLGWAQRQAARAYKEKCAAKHLAAMRADKDHPKHGTRTGYLYGCRCKRCRAASRLSYRMMETRNLLRAMGVDPWKAPR